MKNTEPPNTMTSSQKWDHRFLDLARYISSWSKDTTKIGAVIADNDKSHDVVSMGYNGFPRGFFDGGERLKDRIEKYKYTVHGEMNAIYAAAREGKSLSDNSLYVYGLPVCQECAKGIIQVGIKRVVVNTMDAPQHWMVSCMKAAEFFKEAGVEYRTINL